MAFSKFIGPLLILFTSLINSTCFAINLETFYGNNDAGFIHQYNHRFLNWFLGSQPQLKKCFTDKEAQQINIIIDHWKNWGENYNINNEDYVNGLLLNFEVFYTQSGEDSKIQSGIRLRLPAENHFTYKGIKGDSSVWGVETYLDKNLKCHTAVIKTAKDKSNHETLIFENGEVLILKPRVRGQLKYYFLAIVNSSFPINRDEKLIAEVLSLDLYNLTLMAKQFSPIALSHQREFHQLAIRLRWKNPNEYTVYYP